jgi:hypothetical protein
MALTDDQIAERARELRNQLIREARELQPAEPRPDDEPADGIEFPQLLAAALGDQLKLTARVEELENEVAGLRRTLGTD